MKGWSLVWHYVMDNTHWHMTGLGFIIMYYQNIIFSPLPTVPLEATLWPNWVKHLTSAASGACTAGGSDSTQCWCWGFQLPGYIAKSNCELKTPVSRVRVCPSPALGDATHNRYVFSCKRRCCKTGNLIWRSASFLFLYVCIQTVLYKVRQRWYSYHTLMH